MGESPPKIPNSYAAFMVVALVGAAGSILVALIVSMIMNRWTTFSSDVVFAMAAMVASPAAMSVGVSYFVYRTSKNEYPE